MKDKKEVVKKHMLKVLINFMSIRDKTMDDKLIYIPYDNKPNYPFCVLKLLLKKIENC